MTDKEIQRWFRNLAKLKYKWKKHEQKSKHGLTVMFKSKYYWFLKRLVKMAEQNASGWE